MALVFNGTTQKATKTGLSVDFRGATMAFAFKVGAALAADKVLAIVTDGTYSFIVKTTSDQKVKLEFPNYSSVVTSTGTYRLGWNIVAFHHYGAGGKISISLNGAAYDEASSGGILAGSPFTSMIVGSDGASAFTAAEFAEVAIISGEQAASVFAAWDAAIGEVKPSLSGLTMLYHDRLKTPETADMTLAGDPEASDHPWELSPVHNFEGGKLRHNGLDVATVAYLDAEIAALSAIYAPIAKGVEQHKETIGNGSSTDLTVTHNLNSRDVMITVWDLVTNGRLHPSIELTSVNAAILSFGEAPAENSVRVIVSKRTN